MTSHFPINSIFYTNEICLSRRWPPCKSKPRYPESVPLPVNLSEYIEVSRRFFHQRTTPIFRLSQDIRVRIRNAERHQRPSTTAFGIPVNSAFGTEWNLACRPIGPELPSTAV